jgi:hypothetical protein
VRANTLVAATLGAVAGALAVMWFRPTPDPTPVEGAPRASPSAEGGTPEGPRLDASSAATAAELTKARAHIQSLTAELEAARKKVAVPAAAQTPQPRLGPAEEKLPQAARERAVELGVPESALQAVWDVRWPYYGADAATREALLARLRPHGDDVVRAVVAIAGAGGGHASLPQMVSELKAPGGARLLLDLIAREERGAATLITALPGYDSPEVRTYLVDRIARETDAGIYWHLATALGALREPRGAEVMRIAQFSGPTFGGVRGYILSTIAQMGGPRALQLLEEYLGLTNTNATGAALRALEILDAERARTHARRIKDGDRFGYLPPEDVSEVLRLTR